MEMLSYMGSEFHEELCIDTVIFHYIQNSVWLLMSVSLLSLSFLSSY